MPTLKLLARGARGEIMPAFLEGTAGVDVGRYVSVFHRDVDLAPLERVVEEATTRFADHAAEASDAWLAARVHATLRLSRREAADASLWAYLAVVAFPDYV